MMGAIKKWRGLLLKDKHANKMQVGNIFYLTNILLERSSSASFTLQFFRHWHPVVVFYTLFNSLLGASSRPMRHQFSLAEKK